MADTAYLASEAAEEERIVDDTDPAVGFLETHPLDHARDATFDVPGLHGARRDRLTSLARAPPQTPGQFVSWIVLGISSRYESDSLAG